MERILLILLTLFGTIIVGFGLSRRTYLICIVPVHPAGFSKGPT
jgi:hypothetical protein